MLGKLLKYELKSTVRIFGSIYAVILVVAAVIGVMMRSNVAWLQGDFQFPYYFGSAIGLGIVLLIYFIFLIIMVVMTFVMVLQRFYKNLLTGEGYLMHTLPVPTWMLVAGKLIASVIWYVLAAVVSLFSLYLIVLTGGVLGELSAEIMPDILENYGGMAGLTTEFASEIVAFLFGGVLFILILYTAMAIGGAARSHKKTYSLLAGVGILIVYTMLASFGGNTEITNSDGNIMVTTGLDLLPTIIFSVVLFVLTTLLLHRKLNLE